MTTRPLEDSLDRIGHGIKVCAVINTFDHFMKFFVNSDVLRFLRNKNLTIDEEHAGDVSKFVKSFVETLWYVDSFR